jgi:lipopolysaccharide export LptBFGC system permease protein LptF
MVSLGLIWLSAGVIPRTLSNALVYQDKLTAALIGSLQPGRFYKSDKLGISENEYILYFRERDPQTQEMKGIAIKLDADRFTLGIQSKQEALEETERRHEKKEREARERQTALQDDQQLTAVAPDLPAPLASLMSNPELLENLQLDKRKHDLTMIFASSGRLESEMIEVQEGGPPRLSLRLRLQDGTLHMLPADPADRDYVVVKFKEQEMRQVLKSSPEKELKMSTDKELRAALGGDSHGEALRELTERRVLSLAFFVFTLVGVPLAIRVRPTGKSWAILLAIGLMLGYFVLMQMGLTMVEQGKPLAMTVAWLPNVLYLALGVGLWWRTLKI